MSPTAAGHLHVLEHRDEVLRRDDGRCRVQAPGCRGEAWSVTFIVPAELGGSDDPSNLRAVCGSCRRASRAGGRR